MRRNRKADWARRLVAEHAFSPDDLILPLFVQEGKNVRSAIKSLPGISRLSIDLLVKEAKAAAAQGVPALAVFPATDPKKKSIDAKEAFNPDNLVCRTVKAIKDAVPDIGIICDVALDPYTTHGHDGILYKGDVDNDATIEVLIRQSLVQAKAGCDILAPSDMMDGRIGRIRDVLEEEGLVNTQLLAYSAKYASAFYGPFREAVGSVQAPGKMDKRSYQMDAANIREAMREIGLDIAEGADMVMVKPGMPYLDVVHAATQRYDVPVLAYQVSGEYAMIRAAADSGAFAYEAAMQESLLAFKRAGAAAILTYAALDIARLLNE